MITASKSEESEKLPKSFIRIINFYRICGFAFIEPNNNKNNGLFSKIKNYFLIIYNILSIVNLIINEYFTTPDTNQLFDNLSSKPLMRAIYFMSNCLIYVDVVSAFILSLLRSKKLMTLLKTEDVLIVDTNMKRANMLITSKIIIMSIMSIICCYLWFDLSLGKNTKGFTKFLYSIYWSYTLLIFMIGIIIIPVIYCYMIWIITSQINNLKNNISGNLILSKSKLSFFILLLLNF